MVSLIWSFWVNPNYVTNSKDLLILFLYLARVTIWFAEIEEYAYSDDYGEEYNYDDYEYYIDEDTPAQGEKKKKKNV